MVIQDTLLTAVHMHPAGMVTVTLAVALFRVKLALVGLIVDGHAGGAPSWLTVNVCPATVSVPDRGDVDVFVSTE